MWGILQSWLQTWWKVACRFHNIGLNSRLFESLKQRQDLMRHDFSHQLNDLNVSSFTDQNHFESFLVNQILFADFSIALFFLGTTNFPSKKDGKTDLGNGETQPKVARLTLTSSTVTVSTLSRRLSNLQFSCQYMGNESCHLPETFRKSAVGLNQNAERQVFFYTGSKSCH